MDCLRAECYLTNISGVGGATFAGIIRAGTNTLDGLLFQARMLHFIGLEIKVVREMKAIGHNSGYTGVELSHRLQMMSF
ncbi:MAG: hypothetical protein IPO94_18880 [Saprospiraceae bacterium]|nr:hypothetical protein [Saprospiraceae bacterium]